MNGDGQADVFTSHGELYAGNGAGAPLAGPERFEADSFGGSALADVNGDGLLDVLGYTSYAEAYEGHPLILYNTTRTTNQIPPAPARCPIG